jgi:hypothetical protein
MSAAGMPVLGAVLGGGGAANTPGPAGLGRGVGGAGHRDHSGLGLHEHVVGLAVPSRAARSVPGDVDHEQSRVGGPQGLAVEAEPFDDPRRGVVQEDVGGPPR